MRLVVRQVTEEDAVRHREDGRGRRAPEGEDHDRRHGEARISEQVSHRQP